jgi:thiosulfate dehydrogenase [quinone] large subunit
MTVEAKGAWGAGPNGWQQCVLVMLRFAIGWHLFVQGYGRLASAGLSSELQLRTSTGPIAPFFHWLADVQWLRAATDHATVWGLMIVGVLLMVGLFTRTATLVSIALLVPSVLAHPPLPVAGALVATSGGHEMYIDRTMIEILGLVVSLSFDTGRMAGLDLVIRQRREARAPMPPPVAAEPAAPTPEQDAS